MTRRPLAARMTMQPPKALKQQIHRTELGEEPVEVEVKALLDDLVCDQDAPTLAVGVTTVVSEDPFLDLLPITETIAGVEQVDRYLARPFAKPPSERWASSTVFMTMPTSAPARPAANMRATRASSG